MPDRTRPTGAFAPDPTVGRRRFLASTGLGIGTAALASLLGIDGRRAVAADAPGAGLGLPGIPHVAPKARRMISLFMSGGPSQLETFDYKPMLVRRTGEDLPESVRGGQRLTGMSANQATLPMAGSLFSFRQHGESGAWVSELLPHTAGVADELCIVKSVYTEAINHDPAITFLQTGAQIAGRPSVGAWLSYGLGTENADLPAFCVLLTKGKGGQPLYSRLWGSGFLPATHQGVLFRAGSDPVLYLQNPVGISEAGRRKMLDRLGDLHRLRQDATQDPALDARIGQYELAFRMQASVPEVADLSDEPDSTFDLYGPDARQPGTFAANCLLARRLAERGVRFVQLFHQDWDHHGGLPGGMRGECGQTDRACAALIIDLKRRGMLDDTLVTWGGEFGRTNYSQGKLTADDYGRDHHPRCFTVWLAGGGVKRGLSYGETDELGYNVAEKPVHVHDLHATILHLLGIDHERLTYKHQGRYYRLTDVHGTVLDDLIA